MHAHPQATTNEEAARKGHLGTADDEASPLNVKRAGTKGKMPSGMRRAMLCVPQYACVSHLQLKNVS